MRQPLTRSGFLRTTAIIHDDDGGPDGRSFPIVQRAAPPRPVASKPTPPASLEARARKLQETHFADTGEPISMSRALEMLINAPAPTPTTAAVQSIDAKAERLRAELARRGERISKSEALERVLRTSAA